MIFHWISSLLLDLFAEKQRTRNAFLRGNIHYTAETKRTVFKESVWDLRKIKDPAELLKQDAYIKQLSQDLAKDFQSDSTLSQTLEEIMINLSQGNPDWKKIQALLKKL